jgi:hypothetical protein
VAALSFGSFIARPHALTFLPLFQSILDPSDRSSTASRPSSM